MGGDHYYLLTSLPAPGEPGAPPPVTLGELMDRCRGMERAESLIRVLLLGDDLLRREAFLGGELPEAEATVLTGEQAGGEAPLPEWLTAYEPSRSPKIPGDALWEAYYRWAAAEAARLGSAFLSDWVGFEVALRNALASARAAALSLEASDYLVAPDLAGPPGDLPRIVQDWSAAATPLDALKALDRARREWIERNEPNYTFTDDELAAYATKLILLRRRRRLSEADPEPSAQP